MSIIPGTLRADLRLGPKARVIVSGSGTGVTMQEAIDEAVAGNGDVLLRLPGGEEVSTPVLFNKSGIRVIAVGPTMNPLASGEYHSIYGAASLTDEPAAIISERCVIEGMGFVSQDAGSLFYEGAALLIGGEADASPFGVHIKNCRFPKWGMANRIGIAIEGSSDVLIEECGFEGVGTNLEMGIYIQGACANPVVRNCYFRDCDYAIEHGNFTSGPHFVYQGNVMHASKLLNNNGKTATGMVIGNYSPYATNGTTYDDTVSTLQGLGLDFAGNHYSE